MSNVDVDTFLQDHSSKLPSYLLEHANGPAYLQDRSYDAREREYFETVLEEALDDGAVDVSITRETTAEHGKPLEEYAEHTDIEYLVYEDHGETKRWDMIDEPPHTVVELRTQDKEYELRYEDIRRCQDWPQKSRKLLMENPSAREFVSALEEDFPATVSSHQ